MELKQRRLLLKIKSKILDNGVQIKRKDLFNKNETIVPFDSISDQIVTSFVISKLYLFICIFFCAIFLFNSYDYFIGTTTKNPAHVKDVIFSFMWFSMAAIGTWMRSVRYIGIVCAGTSLFFMDKKGSQNPRNYIDSILEARKHYFNCLETEYKNEERCHVPELNGILN
jgi:hypothetical protein